MKTCNDCKINKEYTEYYKSSAGRYKQYKGTSAAYNSTCILCSKAQKRDYNLKKKYGITQKDYNKMFTDQEGCCKICDIHVSDLTRDNLCVDHDHETGKVRALLCVPCNVALGHYKDDIDIIQRALNYLKEHK